jgi:hypothetical protein
VILLSISLGDHEIIPEPGTARRVRDGEPASLLNPADYPAEATCLVCSRPIRNERFYLSEWRHIARNRDR